LATPTKGSSPKSGDNAKDQPYAQSMSIFRAMIRAYPHLAALLLALALAMKALIPAGMMVSSGSRSLSVEICADSLGQRITKQITIANTQPHPADAAKADMAKKPCAFAAHAAPLLGGADGWLLAGALAFILALGFITAPTLLLPRRAHLLPPPCGPPALA